MSGEARSSWDGAEYERVSAPQRRVGEAFVAALDVAGVRRILDVGCGDGFLTEKIARRSTAEVVGVDASPGMLGKARTRESAALRFELADVTAMQLDEGFDLVVSLNTLHWVTRLDVAFQRMFAAQTPGGELVCQLVGASEAPSVEDAASDVAGNGGWREFFGEGFQPYVHPSEERLRELAAAAGYSVIECSAWGEVFEFTSAEEFERWCAAGMTVWTDLLPLERRAAFVHEVTQRYGLATGSGREFHFAQVRLRARAPRR